MGDMTVNEEKLIDSSFALIKEMLGDMAKSLKKGEAIEKGKFKYEADGIIELENKSGRIKRLLLEADDRTNITAPHLRNRIIKLKSIKGMVGDETQVVFCVKYASEPMIEECASEQINVIDEFGDMHISFDCVRLIQRKRFNNPYYKKDRKASVLSKTSKKLLNILKESSEETKWTAKSLADASDQEASAYSAHYLVKELAKKGIVKKTSTGFFLADRKKLEDILNEVEINEG